MENPIEFLIEKRSQILEEVKKKKEGALEFLKIYDDAIEWLKVIDELQLKSCKKYEIIELPDCKQRGLYGEYHIMNDLELEDISNWVELEINSKIITPIYGDILIIRK